MDLYNTLSNLKSDIFFKKYSDVYVDEFFMYIYINSVKEDIFPTIEIYDILSNLTEDLIKKINHIFNQNICKFKYLENENIFKLGQENLIKYMKEIFNHDCISDMIKKININIIYNNINFVLNVYNNDNISNIKTDITEYLLYIHSIKINVKRIILQYNKFILDDSIPNKNNLNFYNINDNSTIHVLINMDYRPLY